MTVWKNGPFVCVGNFEYGQDGPSFCQHQAFTTKIQKINTRASGLKTGQDSRRRVFSANEDCRYRLQKPQRVRPRQTQIPIIINAIYRLIDQWLP
jgi:hypothetical protein